VSKYENLIIRQPVPADSLPHHESGVGLEYPVFLSADMVPEAALWIGYFLAPRIPAILAENIQQLGKAVLHRHSEPEVYLIIGEEGAITAEVVLEDETYEVSSPACVYVPAGMNHSIRPLRATEGKCAGFIPILLGGRYETLPPKDAGDG